MIKELEAALQARDEAIRLRDEAYMELSALADQAQRSSEEAEYLRKELERARLSITFTKIFKGLYDRCLDGANQETMMQISGLATEIETLKKQMSADSNMQQAQIAYLEKQLHFSEKDNRALRSKVAELKGNIRVFARVRPFLPIDGEDGMNPHVISLSDGESVKVVKSDRNTIEEMTFRFDKCFGPEADQQAVFNEVSEFVQSALDGFNGKLRNDLVHEIIDHVLLVCIFSYGQTGSGKTYTMTGGTEDSRGIIPRAMNLAGRYQNELSALGWVYTMSVTYVEIYNENVKDLLSDDSGNMDYEIKRDQEGRVYVSNAVVLSIDPNDAAQVNSILDRGSSRRSVATTNLNEESSRSHAIFTLHMKAVNEKEGLELRGSLSLVDLAGSERLDRSGATGEVAKSAMAINKSLSALADVFLAIRRHDSHIPYRNSKLTNLLQGALGGEGKTLMLLSLSPTKASSFESYCSCRFATQVNKCELGKPRKRIMI